MKKIAMIIGIDSLFLLISIVLKVYNILDWDLLFFLSFAINAFIYEWKLKRNQSKKQKAGMYLVLALIAIIFTAFYCGFFYYYDMLQFTTIIAIYFFMTIVYIIPCLIVSLICFVLALCSPQKTNPTKSK